MARLSGWSDHGFDAVRIAAGVQRLLDVAETKFAGHQFVEMNATGSREGDGGRPCIRVPDCARDMQLATLN